MTVDIEEVSRKRLEGRVAKVVSGLHQLADRVEQEAARYITAAAEGRHEWSTYAQAAGQVQHEISWGLANLNVSGLIETAGDADRARGEKSAVDPRVGLDAMIDVAGAWARERGSVAPAAQVHDAQMFTFDDIMAMILDAANQAGLRPIGEEKS